MYGTSGLIEKFSMDNRKVEKRAKPCKGECEAIFTCPHEMERIVIRDHLTTMYAHVVLFCKLKGAKVGWTAVWDNSLYDKKPQWNCFSCIACKLKMLVFHSKRSLKLAGSEVLTSKFKRFS